VQVGEYFSEKEESRKFYVRNRMEWERHITELTAEGKDVLQWMYRMEYTSFLKQCTSISPQVQVNDEMSRHRTGRDSITVEMIFHCLLQ